MSRGRSVRPEAAEVSRFPRDLGRSTRRQIAETEKRRGGEVTGPPLWLSAAYWSGSMAGIAWVARIGVACFIVLVTLASVVGSPSPYDRSDAVALAVPGP